MFCYKVGTAPGEESRLSKQRGLTWPQLATSGHNLSTQGPHLATAGHIWPQPFNIVASPGHSWPQPFNIEASHGHSWPHGRTRTFNIGASPGVNWTSKQGPHLTTTGHNLSRKGPHLASIFQDRGLTWPQPFKVWVSPGLNLSRQEPPLATTGHNWPQPFKKGALTGFSSLHRTLRCENKEGERGRVSHSKL